eukprot:TRINITY_DN15439_c0_g1_i1.p1 TRINITY_DN15439_c0_g1~~TRINITY_DN15439_c0_g1_i1.p1  ORF type:complete len:257 (+),score=94.52 TRINITY_DN15439_c0_g1_i1:51-821(+)
MPAARRKSVGGANAEKSKGGAAPAPGKKGKDPLAGFAVRSKNDLEIMFDGYLVQAGNNPHECDSMNEQALAAFAEDMGIPKDDPLVLMLAFRLECAGSFSITRGEWVHGFQELSITSHAGVRTYLKALSAELCNPDPGDQFTNFYNFSYDFIRSDPTRFLPLDTAIQYWRRILIPHFKLLPEWCNYLVDESGLEGKGVTRDLWQQLWVFAQNTPSLEDHSAQGAYPVIIDNFVEWAMNPGGDAEKDAGDSGDVTAS